MTDHVYTHELLREDEWTDDERLLITDSVSWWEQIPLMHEGSILGAVGNIRREGNRIYGDTDVEIPEDAVLTADVDQITSVVEGHRPSEGRVRISSARLIAANVSEKGTYPWHDEEREGGDANAR